MGKRNEQDWEPKTLKAFIEHSGHTQRSLAKKIGVPENTVNYWVKKKMVPRADSMILLCKELNISLKTLLKSLEFDVSEVPDDTDNN